MMWLVDWMTCVVEIVEHVDVIDNINNVVAFVSQLIYCGLLLSCAILKAKTFWSLPNVTLWEKSKVVPKSTRICHWSPAAINWRSQTLSFDWLGLYALLFHTLVLSRRLAQPRLLVMPSQILKVNWLFLWYPIAQIRTYLVFRSRTFIPVSLQRNWLEDLRRFRPFFDPLFLQSTLSYLPLTSLP